MGCFGTSPAAAYYENIEDSISWVKEDLTSLLNNTVDEDEDEHASRAQELFKQFADEIRLAKVVRASKRVPLEEL